VHIEHMRDANSEMPLHEKPDAVSSLKIWHCSYNSLSSISQYSNLRAVEIASFPNETLRVFGCLSKLEWLRIVHLPKVEDLGPLASHDKLRSLSLATLPSWDSSGKVTTVESLSPLCEIPHLEHLELFGVRPIDRSLRDLYRCEALKNARFSKYPKGVVRRFYESTGIGSEFLPEFTF